MKIQAQQREETGTSASKRARREGLIPAAIYGSSVDTISVLIDRKDFEDTVREIGLNGIFEIEVEGDETYQVFVKDQTNAALEDLIYHVDLQAFLAGETVVMEIPIYLDGYEELEEAIANQSITELEIEVAPSEAPSEITVDISGLEIGDSISVGDLEIEGNPEILTDLDSTVVSISPPEEEIEEDEDLAPDSDEMVEPEVIGASDDEDEEEEEE